MLPGRREDELVRFYYRHWKRTPEYTQYKILRR